MTLDHIRQFHLVQVVSCQFICLCSPYDYLNCLNVSIFYLRDIFVQCLYADDNSSMCVDDLLVFSWWN